jgi:predicted 2-oxoglutarate/Fe(II)-dependent dioxygenase YbiX
MDTTISLLPVLLPYKFSRCFSAFSRLAKVVRCVLNCIPLFTCFVSKVGIDILARIRKRDCKMMVQRLVPTTMMSISISILLLAPSASVLGFTFTTTPHPRLLAWELCAKKAKAGKSKQPAAAARGGGFGSSVTKTAPGPKIVDDFAVFPALEPQVKETLVPAEAATGAGELSNEMYQRIDQIYGFSSFNYPTTKQGEEEPEAMSFTDMISASSTDDNDDDLPASTTNKDPELPLASLPPFDKFRVLHVDPMVLQIDDFFTDEECDRYVTMSLSDKKQVMESRSPTVGKDANAKAQRTSTTWYHHYKGVPELMAKASRLLGLDGIDHWEEPQTVRYRRNEKFTWHVDALGPDESKMNLGGQRTATLILYLTDLQDNEGGATMFRDLGGSSGGPLRVQPRKGSALLFFPAAGGIPLAPFDIRTLHCGEVVAEDSSQDKWISQLWLRQGVYAPTAPDGNLHSEATDAISNYCSSN